MLTLRTGTNVYVRFNFRDTKDFPLRDEFRHLNNTCHYMEVWDQKDEDYPGETLLTPVNDLPFSYLAEGDVIILEVI